MASEPSEHYRVGSESGHDIYMVRHGPGYFAPSLPAAGRWNTVDQMKQRIRQALKEATNEG